MTLKRFRNDVIDSPGRQSVHNRPMRIPVFRSGSYVRAKSVRPNTVHKMTPLWDVYARVANIRFSATIIVVSYGVVTVNKVAGGTRSNELNRLPVNVQTNNVPDFV